MEDTHSLLLLLHGDSAPDGIRAITEPDNEQASDGVCGAGEAWTCVCVCVCV